MATFTVHVPPGVADLAARAERTAFVRDGFSLRAFLLGPAYLLYHRLWREALVWLVAAGLLAVLARGLDLPVAAGLGLYGVLAVLTGLEAGEARHRSLQRQGYATAAVVAGASRQASERAFFAAQAFGPPPAAVADPRRGPRADGSRRPVIGLFPAPGGRG